MSLDTSKARSLLDSIPYKRPSDLLQAAFDRHGREAVELQMSLNVGDQIICLEQAYFDYNEEVKKKKIISQRVGQIIRVNNPGVFRNPDGSFYHISDSVGGNGICDGEGFTASKDNRPCLGLGCSLKIGTYRLAKPSDKGYLGTKEFWLENGIDREGQTFRKVMTAVCAVMFIWVMVSGG